MTNEAILGKLQALFQDLFDDSDLTITMDTTADDVEDWDSLMHINLIMSVEKEFGVKFALGEREDMKNVGEMVELIKKKSA